MLDDRPATAFLVQAHIRKAMQEGVPMVVIHKGDPRSGTLILKINLLNGKARVFTEVRFENERHWTPATNTDPMPEKDADAYLSRQISTDPDVWIVEIEDKQGRLWFPGKIVDVATKMFF